MFDNLDEVPELELTDEQRLDEASSGVETDLLVALMRRGIGVPPEIDLLKESDFSDKMKGVVFGVLRSIWNSGNVPEASLVLDKLRRLGHTSLDYFVNEMEVLSAGLKDYGNTTSYISIIKDVSQRRRTNTIAKELAECASKTEGNIVHIIESSVASLLRVTTDVLADDVYTSRQLVDMERRSDELSEEEAHIPTGIAKLDKYIGGLDRGSMYVIAASTRIGKTVLGVNVAANALINHNKRVLYFSLEMSRGQMIRRFYACMGELGMSEIKDSNRDKKTTKLLEKVRQKFASSELLICCRGSLTHLDIRSLTRKYLHTGLDLVIVDYLQILKPEGKSFSREREVASMSQSLKSLAMDMHLPVIVLSQVNRSPVMRGDGRPHLHDLRESGAIEQDADVVIMLHRNIPDSGIKDRRLNDEQAEVIIAKNRNGPPGSFLLHWDSDHLRFI